MRSRFDPTQISLFLGGRVRGAGYGHVELAMYVPILLLTHSLRHLFGRPFVSFRPRRGASSSPTRLPAAYFFFDFVIAAAAADAARLPPIQSQEMTGGARTCTRAPTTPRGNTVFIRLWSMAHFNLTAEGQLLRFIR